MRIAAGLCALLALAGCSGPVDPPAGQGSGGPGSGGAPIVDRPAVAASSDDGDEVQIVAATATSSPDAGGRAVRQESDYYEFDYAFPEEADDNPVLRKWFETDLAAARDKHLALARKGRDAALAERKPFRRYKLVVRWKTIADTPGFMSLSAYNYTFQGEPRGAVTYRSFVWDKAAVARRPTRTLFAPRALAKAIRVSFCAELARMQAEKRPRPANPRVAAASADCPDSRQGAVVLGTTDNAHLDKFSVVLAPGQAGPESEGSYEVKLPVTAAVVAAARPRFRKAFAVTTSPNASESPM